MPDQRNRQFSQKSAIFTSDPVIIRPGALTLVFEKIGAEVLHREAGCALVFAFLAAKLVRFLPPRQFAVALLRGIIPNVETAKGFADVAGLTLLVGRAPQGNAMNHAMQGFGNCSNRLL